MLNYDIMKQEQWMDSSDEEDMFLESAEFDSWKYFRIQQWTEDVTVKWIRSLPTNWLALITHKWTKKITDDQYINQVMEILSNQIMDIGIDGLKLKDSKILTKHPRCITIKQQYKALESLFLWCCFKPHLV